MARPRKSTQHPNTGKSTANVERRTVSSVDSEALQALVPFSGMLQTHRPVNASAGSLDSVLVERILSACLLDDGAPAQNTSVRLPGRLHGAAMAAVESGAAGSLSEIIVEGVRLRLLRLAESAAAEVQIADIRSALEEHYAEFPNARPSLSEIVKAAAVMDGHQAAEHPDLVAEAIEDLGEDADVEDVLAWVRGALAQRNMVSR